MLPILIPFTIPITINPQNITPPTSPKTKPRSPTRSSSLQTIPSTFTTTTSSSSSSSKTSTSSRLPKFIHRLLPTHSNSPSCRHTSVATSAASLNEVRSNERRGSDGSDRSTSISQGSDEAAVGKKENSREGSVKRVKRGVRRLFSSGGMTVLQSGEGEKGRDFSPGCRDGGRDGIGGDDRGENEDLERDGDRDRNEGRERKGELRNDKVVCLGDERNKRVVDEYEYGDGYVGFGRVGFMDGGWRPLSGYETDEEYEIQRREREEREREYEDGCEGWTADRQWEQSHWSIVWASVI